MAKSIIRIISAVKEELSQYKLSDDFPIDPEYLIDKANDVRATLIRDEFRNGNVNGKFYMKICCLDIICEKEGCTINGKFYNSGSLLWTMKLPALVSGIGWFDISYLGSDGFEDNFKRYNLQGWMNLEGNIMTGTKPAYTIVGDTAYFKNLPTQGIAKVCMVGVPYNPVSICNYKKDTDEYPVPSDTTLQMLMKKDILSTYHVVPDPHQDGRAPDIYMLGGQSQKKQNDQQENQG